MWTVGLSAESLSLRDLIEEILIENANLKPDESSSTSDFCSRSL